MGDVIAAVGFPWVSAVVIKVYRCWRLHCYCRPKNWLKDYDVAVVPVSVNSLSAAGWCMFLTFLTPPAVVGISVVVGWPAVAGVPTVVNIPFVVSTGSCVPAVSDR